MITAATPENYHEKHRRIKERFTQRERIVYFIQRYIIFAIILIPSLIYLHFVDITKGESSLLILLVTRLCRCTLGVGLAMLFTKFCFPRMALTTEIVEEHNLSAGLIFASIVIAVNL